MSGSGDENTVDGFVTPEQVTAFLGGEDGVEQPSEDWLDIVIAAVTGSIVNFTGRDYREGDELPGVRVYQRFGDDLTLAIDDCREVTKVQVSHGTGWSDLEGDQWVAEPTSEPMKNKIRFLRSDLPSTGSGWYFGGEVDPDNTAWPKHARAEGQAVTFVQVTAKWGWTEVPGHIVLATLTWISHIHRKDKAYFSEAFAQGAKSILDIPPDVLRIIDSDSGSGPGVAAV